MIVGRTATAEVPRRLLSRLLALVALCGGLYGCSSVPDEPLPTVDYVDIDRFMGDWYVIANIPTFIEKGAHNAVESYQLAADGSIETTFTFRQDAFDGPEKRYSPRGFVRNKETNAEWGMRFVWPFKAEYLVIYLDGNYTQTVIGRSKRDYVWIMSRTPDMPEADYKRILSFLGASGYDTDSIRKVPQRWD